MSNPNDPKAADGAPKTDNRLVGVILTIEIRLGKATTKVWQPEIGKGFGFRAALTQFGVRFEPAEPSADERHPVTVPLAHVAYVQHPAVKIEPNEPMPPMPTRVKP